MPTVIWAGYAPACHMGYKAALYFAAHLCVICSTDALSIMKVKPSNSYTKPVTTNAHNLLGILSSPFTDLSLSLLIVVREAWSSPLALPSVKLIAFHSCIHT